MQLSPHRRQFVIAQQRHEFGEGWLSRELPDGFVLSYQEDLSVSGSVSGSVPGSDDGVLTLGGAYPGAASRAGRFVTVAWPFVGADSSALLPVHFAHGPQGPVVSSSAALLARLCPGEQVDRSMWWGGLNWVPGPGSPLVRARKLLPGQRLRLPDLQVDEAPSPPLTSVSGSMEEARTVLAEELTATVGQAARSGSPTYLALTAGLDSRTLLAACLAAGVRFEAVTKVVGSPADVRVAAEICAYLGVRHHVITPQPHDETVLRAWREHTVGAYDDADNQLLLPRDQYRFLDKGTVVLRGGVFELGRRFYASKLAGLDAQDARDVTGAVLWRRLDGGSPPDARTVEHLDLWLAARRERHDGLDLVDGFYRDQRLGGWAASVEHGLDLLPGVSVSPANSHRVMGALMTPSPQERAAGSLQRAVLADLAPQLSRFPINPRPTGLAGHIDKARIRAGRAARILRQRAS